MIAMEMLAGNYKPMVAIGEHVQVFDYQWFVRALVCSGDLYLVVAYGYFDGG